MIPDQRGEHESYLKLEHIGLLPALLERLNDR